MSQLHQIQLKFVPLEDRLLLLLNTSDKAEFKLWLTRRYVKLLWQTLLQLLEKSMTHHHYTDPQKTAAILSFQHEQVIKNADFSSQYEQKPQATMPLGNEPILVSKIQIKQRDDDVQVLCLHPDEGKGIEIALDETLLHSFCKILSEAVKNTEWDLDLQISSQHVDISQKQWIN